MPTDAARHQAAYDALCELSQTATYSALSNIAADAATALADEVAARGHDAVGLLDLAGWHVDECRRLTNVGGADAYAQAAAHLRVSSVLADAALNVEAAS